ncbi:uncharacterized protein LOC123879142 isoform X1 [Maniola jurtina]|uniref:uncharacterized protein LOC123872852 isoform X1 n=1 Tax=Maniola jurtina TaxID=191418 RepID=UPI001E687348|nr:uncharacterized protein LOC123872852 isoform X1 [Maniola jurtina]XP_045773394.1 uncharacterized protein LOC123872852 isoform X1 [Maniola jurtina]XP_045782647.1 uncharacterized protein LOC123879142 isoform X1 [Maniola jurtina]XP_045782648.1 uncharacterized protein LOC123879142 isoform X1 [Maniola jurtina]
MGKRKAEEREAKIRKKIRKLEKKLAPKRGRIMRLPSSSSDENNDVNQSENDALCDPLSVYFDTTAVHDDERPDIMSATALPGTAVETTVLQDSGADSAVPGPEGSTDPELDGSILSLLGDAPENNSELGLPIHKDIATRWQEILQKGLKEDIKKDLIKLYPIPNNLEILIPPILNPEVKAALTEPLVKRDFAIFHRQKQTGIALSALGRSVDSIVNDPDKSLQNIEIKSALLRPISDACRILCDLYQLETKRRRTHIINSINNKMKDIVMDTVPGKYLFGDNISEKLKTAQGINRSGQILKVIPNKTPFSNSNKNTMTATPSNVKSLNQRTPYRKTAARSYMGKQRLQDRAAPATVATSSRQRHYRRSPPPPPPRRQRQQRY